MKIYLDMTPAIRAPATGIGRVTSSLGEAIAQLGQSAPWKEKFEIHRTHRKGPAKVFSSTLGKPKTLYQSFEHRLPPVLFSRKILTIHDCWTLWPNEWQSPDFQKRQSRIQSEAMARADAILVPTQHVKNEIARFDARLVSKVTVSAWASPQEKISVGDLQQAPTRLQEILESPRPLLMHVGVLEARKNQTRLLEALRGLLPAINVLFVSSTRGGYGAEASRKILADLVVEKSFLHLEGLAPEFLKLAYARANLCVLPSWDEGFGLALEAMSQGAPLLLSDIPPFREVAAELATYFDPRIAPAELRKKIEEQLGQSSEAKKSALIERAENFSWKKTAEAYFKVYQGFLG